jgi:glucosyl-3-phosphoglycerate synthase
MKDNISVIIPALNEESTIGNIVESAKNTPGVDEVIVVDDKSFDNTVQVAAANGAKVVTGTKLGKGASMRDGMLVATNDILIFLDADVSRYSDNLIGILTTPIINNEFDFVKSKFSRQAGRVTELVAKPLISLLFPKIGNISQPLSGMIAGRRSLFERVTFEDDYGVDIGLLIDMHLLGARICEVDIGEIDHKMKPWHQLTKMSREVSRAILKRAKNLALVQLDNLETFTLIGDQMDDVISETVKSLKKMVVFDMDNTLFNGKFIDKAAEVFGFQRDLTDIVSKNQDSFLITKLIARLLKGKSIADLLAVAESIPIVADAEEVISRLHDRGYIVGIVTDSYDCIANYLKNKLNIDFSLANELEFSQSVATGEVKVPSYFCKNDTSSCHHTICKGNALEHASGQFSIDKLNIIAIGDGENDICMVRQAGIGVAICSASKLLNEIADYCLMDKSFKPILNFAE